MHLIRTLERNRERGREGERERTSLVRSLIRMDIFYDREVGQLPLFLGYLIGRLSSWYRSPRNPSTLEWRPRINV